MVEEHADQADMAARCLAPTRAGIGPTKSRSVWPTKIDCLTLSGNCKNAG